MIFGASRAFGMTTRARCALLSMSRRHSVPLPLSQAQLDLIGVGGGVPGTRIAPTGRDDN
jgi:hypothetical protein